MFYISILKNFNNYKLIWTSSYIAFYINNKLIRMIKDEKVIHWINEDPWMKVIFQMGVRKEYNDKCLESLKSPMVIKDFRYTKISQ